VAANLFLSYKMQIIFMTDLDGTLIGHHDFEFGSIRSAINNFCKIGVTLIPNSSKTCVEIENFCKRLGRSLTFISENGAAINNSDLLLNSVINNRIDKKVLGVNAEELFDLWNKSIDPILRKNCIFLDDISKSKQEELLGLKGQELANALRREYSIIFNFVGSADAFDELQRQCKKVGLVIHKGGRVYNLSGTHDKSNFIEAIKSRCLNGNEEIVIIGFGDSQNDIAMLQASDIACIVPRPNASKLFLPNPPEIVIEAPEVAPTGWVQAATMALTKLNIKAGDC